MRTLPLLFLGLTIACRGPGGDGDGDTNDGLTGDTGTTTTHDGFKPRYFGVTDVRFAVDDAGRARGYTSYTGSDEPISLEITIGDASVETGGFTATNSCVITLVADGPVSDAPWSTGVAAWSGFEMPAAASAFTTCDALDFPPAWGDPVDVITAWTWGFGVGALNSDVRSALEDSMGSDFADIEPYVVGGGAYWNGLKDLDDPDLAAWKSGYIDTGVTFAYEVDASYVQQLVGNNPVLLEADTLHAGGVVARALYEMQGTTVLSPTSILLP